MPHVAARPRRQSGVSTWTLVIIATALVSALVLPLPRTGDSSTSARYPWGAERPFSIDSPWNTPIPPRPAVDRRSRAIVAHLSGGNDSAVANLYESGVPVWDADDQTPRYDIRCLKPWGTCQLEEQPVPVPDGATATPVDADGAMVVIDWSARRAFEFYEAERVDGRWRAGWGGVVSLDGPGTPGAAVGAGVSRLAGVVRVIELARGRIEHALVFSTDNACHGAFRYPASKSDGTSRRHDCIPEGSRIQLDPGIDVDGLPGATSAEKVLARALQVYGAYAIDNGGARMAFIFEVPSGEADVYARAGLAGDYHPLNGIPWRFLRVLQSWDGR